VAGRPVFIKANVQIWGKRTMSRFGKVAAWLVLLAVVAAPTAALVVALRRPAEAVVPVAAVLEIAPEPPMLLFETAAWKREARMPYELVVRSEMQRIKLDRVLRGALGNLVASGKPLPAALRNQESPIDWLKRNLVVQSNGKFLTVGLRADLAPAERAEIINEVASAYISDVRDERETWLGRQQGALKLYAKYRNELRDLREKLQRADLEVTEAHDGTPNLTPALMKTLAERTAAELARLQTDMRAAEAERTVRARAGCAESATDEADVDERIAILAEQVRRTTEEAVEYHTKAEWVPPHVAALREEVRIMEGFVQETGRELRRSEFEANAPDRIRLADPASPGAK
jgi:hypothetical protein